MRRAVCFITVALLFLAFPAFSVDALDTAALSPPLIRCESRDYNGCTDSALAAALLTPPELHAFALRCRDSNAEFATEYGYSGYTAYALFDASVGSDNAWHCGEAVSPEACLSRKIDLTQSVQKRDVFWLDYPSDCDYFAGHLITLTSEDGSTSWQAFDYSKQLFIRVCFYIVPDSGAPFYTPWSAAVQPDSAVNAAPSLSELSIYPNDNANLVAAFNCRFGEASQAMLASFLNGDGLSSLRVRLRINNGEYTEISLPSALSDGAYAVTPENTPFSADAYVELSAGISSSSGEIFWSEVLTVGENPDAVETTVAAETTAHNAETSALPQEAEEPTEHSGKQVFLIILLAIIAGLFLVRRYNIAKKHRTK